MLSEEETKKIKEQLIKQIDLWNIEEEKKEEAKKQIQEMPSKQLEEFLIKNKLLSQKKQECPFCLIVEKKIPSYKIEENEKALAVLEINPLSSGHTLIIPKKHLGEEEIPNECFEFAKKISKTIKEKLKPKEINLQTSQIAGHSVMNIIPLYEKEKQERKKASEEELKNLQKKLTEKTIKKEKLEKPKKPEKAPKRMP